MRATTVAVALAAAVVLARSASAQQAKCLAGKTKCMAKAGTGLLKCEQLAETPGKPADPDAGGCSTKVLTKFDGGLDATKGCFAKLESKIPNDCITFNDTTPAENAVGSCVGSFVSAIDPAAPPPTQAKCDAGKKKCVAKLLAGILKCHGLAQTPGKPADPNTGGCVDKAVAKYTGGIDPTKGCVAKLEAKNPNDCEITGGDSTTLKNLVDDCVANLVALESNTTTTTTSTTATTTTIASGVVLKGSLTSTLGRFNYCSSIGLPAANSCCNTHFNGTHACTYAELQSAQAAGDLVGLKDFNGNTVTAFWAIDNTQPALQQCQDDAPGSGSLLNWEYGTGHTASKGEKVSLDNPNGTLGALQMNQACFFGGTGAWVGCCQ